MADWKAERDALVSETMAFVQVVRSQTPVSAEPIVAPMQVLADVLAHSQEVASPVPERSQPTFDETVEPQPMKRNLELERQWHRKAPAFMPGFLFAVVIVPKPAPRWIASCQAHAPRSTTRR